MNRETAWSYVPAKTEEVFEYLIRDEVCRARKLPWLTAIAVSANSRLPSGGFFPDDAGVSANLESDDFKIWWRGMVLQVFATDWSAVELQPRAGQ